MFTFKKCLIALSINLAVVSSGFACTTLLVGNEASADGSMLVARSADSDALKAQHFVIHPAKQNQTGVYSTKAHNGANDFTWPLPKTRCVIPLFQTGKPNCTARPDLTSWALA